MLPQVWNWHLTHGPILHVPVQPGQCSHQFPVKSLVHPSLEDLQSFHYKNKSSGHHFSVIPNIYATSCLMQGQLCLTLILQGRAWQSASLPCELHPPDETERFQIVASSQFHSYCWDLHHHERKHVSPTKWNNKTHNLHDTRRVYPTESFLQHYCR